jgi:hypothetical protein
MDVIGLVIGDVGTDVTGLVFGDVGTDVTGLVFGTMAGAVKEGEAALCVPSPDPHPPRASMSAAKPRIEKYRATRRGRRLMRRGTESR